jgi:PilZ domain-containing protein
LLERPGVGSIEARRSPRILFQVPLRISADGGMVRGHTVVVNRQGALVLSPLRVAEETLLKVENALSGASLLCRVAFCGGEELPGLYKLGIEILGPTADFWGNEFESRMSEVPPQTAG